jgi:hypothetical protein
VGTTDEAESGGCEMIKRTPYCSENQSFSDAAHEAAERMVYPVIFPNCDIKYKPQSVADGGESQNNDGKKAIDYVLEVESKKFYVDKRHTFTVQERWRSVSAIGFNDVTITASNPMSGMRSEWEKMQCQFMVYGFYCGEYDVIRKAFYVDVVNIRRKAIAGHSEYQFACDDINQRSKQPFYGVPIGLPEIEEIRLDDDQLKEEIRLDDDQLKLDFLD